MFPKHKVVVNINIDWRIILLLSVIVTLLGVTYYTVSGKQEVETSTSNAPSKATIFTGYYNLMSFEGIPVAGDFGTAPPVGDYTSTNCRFINVQNTQMGDYYLQYPLHLPNGVTISAISLHVADFNNNYSLYAYLKSRLWNSREAGTIISWAYTYLGVTGDTTIDMDTNSLGVKVNNDNYEYWIQVATRNGTDPGQLCVYGIQVTYTYDGSLLPLVVRNN